MNIELNDLKALQESGHTLQSVILMLEKKQQYKAQKRHWFIIKDGRNICEFCGCLYAFGGETLCNADVPQGGPNTLNNNKT